MYSCDITGRASNQNLSNGRNTSNYGKMGRLYAVKYFKTIHGKRKYLEFIC